MMKKFVSLLAALAILAGVTAMTTDDAEARGRRGGNVAAGIAIGTVLGLGIAGAYAGQRYYGGGPAYYADVPPGCYRGPRQCGWAGRRCWIDRYGDEVCRGGEWRCWRPTICD